MHDIPLHYFKTNIQVIIIINLITIKLTILSNIQDFSCKTIIAGGHVIRIVIIFQFNKCFSIVQFACTAHFKTDVLMVTDIILY